jgi:hypothetical protein
MFLTPDQEDNTAAVLHHFTLFRCATKPPQLAALADKCEDLDQVPQLLFLLAKEICGTTEFSIPTNTSNDDIKKLGAKNSTLVSPRNKTEHQTALLLRLPWHWAPSSFRIPCPCLRPKLTSP